MGWVGIILAVVVVACAVGAVNSTGMAKGLCGAGVCVAALLIVLRIVTGGGQPRIELDWSFEETAGHRLGQAIVDDAERGALGAPGGEVVVAVYNVSESHPDLKKKGAAYWTGISDQIEGTNVRLVACPARIAEEAHNWSVGRATGSDDLVALLRKAAESVPGASALVTFNGIPVQASPEALAGLPPLYSVESSLSDPVSGLLRKGILRGVISFSDDADWDAKPDPTLSWQEHFKQRYEYTASPAT